MHVFSCSVKHAWNRQEKYKIKVGQRGRLPVQALRFVNSANVILWLPEKAGVHFLWRSHDSIREVITQFRNDGPRGNTEVFNGYIAESWCFWIDNSVGDIFSQFLGNKMAHADGWKYYSEWSTKTSKRSDWHVIKFVAAVMGFALWLF